MDGGEWLWDYLGLAQVLLANSIPFPVSVFEFALEPLLPPEGSY